MSHGRCAGCGKTSPSCKIIKTHIMTCPDYVSLFKEDASRALQPEEEYVRWSEEENNPEARAIAKDIRLTKRFA